MKKLVLAALLAGTATAASAQSTVVKVNILSPLVNTGSFFAEHRLSAHGSAQLGAFFTYSNGAATRLRSIGITPEYRFYLSDTKPALQGFYAAPFVRYTHSTFTFDDWDQNASNAPASRLTYNAFGGGLVVGHQWLFKRRISLDAYLGPSYSFNSVRLELPDADFDKRYNPRGFGVRAGITFGVAF